MEWVLKKFAKIFEFLAQFLHLWENFESGFSFFQTPFILINSYLVQCVNFILKFWKFYEK